MPSLPLFVRQLMIAARIVEVQPVDRFAVAVSVTTLSQRLVPDNIDGFDVNIVGEYILITLRDIPLSEEGLYRFGVAVEDNEPVTLELTVGLVARQPEVNIQSADLAFEQASRRDVN